MPPDWRTRLWAARETALLATGAALLLCAQVLPGVSRLAVLPALLLAPGYALLRLLGQVTGWQSISLAVPASLTIIAGAALLLDVSGIALGAPSLGSLLGAGTALFLAGSYGPQLAAGVAWRRNRETPPGGGHRARRDVPAGKGG